MEKQLCYISFATTHWLGGAFIELTDAERKEPLARLAQLGVNPGGDILIVRAPRNSLNVAERFRNRLLATREEVETAASDETLLVKDAIRDGFITEGEFERGFKPGGIATSVCESCNPTTEN